MKINMHWVYSNNGMRRWLSRISTEQFSVTQVRSQVVEMNSTPRRSTSDQIAGERKLLCGDIFLLNFDETSEKQVRNMEANKSKNFTWLCINKYLPELNINNIKQTLLKSGVTFFNLHRMEKGYFLTSLIKFQVDKNKTYFIYNQQKH